MAPDADEKVERDQHHFPEKVKEEEVNRQKDAGEGNDDPEQVEVEETDALLNASPRGGNGHDAQEVDQQEQDQAEAVQCQVEVDAQLRNPGNV